MLIQQFILQNAHFALSLFAALVFFAVSWLYLDAYFSIKSKKDLFKIIGFCFLSFSFLIHSTYIEQTILVNPILSTNLVELASDLTKFSGFIFLILGLLAEGIQAKPEHVSTASEQTASDVEVKTVPDNELPIVTAGEA